MPQTVSVEKLQNEPIVIMHLHETDQSQASSRQEFTAQIVTVLDAASEPVFLVFDMGDIRPVFSDIASGTHEATHGSNFLAHPNVREILTVTSNRVFRLATMGLRSKAFGNLKVQIFETVEEALEYARSNMET